MGAVIQSEATVSLFSLTFPSTNKRRAIHRACDMRAADDALGGKARVQWGPRQRAMSTGSESNPTKTNVTMTKPDVSQRK